MIYLDENWQNGSIIDNGKHILAHVQAFFVKFYVS